MVHEKQARLTLMARLASTCRPSALTKSSVSESTHLKRPSGDPNNKIITLFEMWLRPFLPIAWATTTWHLSILSTLPSIAPSAASNFESTPMAENLEEHNFNNNHIQVSCIIPDMLARMPATAKNSAAQRGISGWRYQGEQERAKTHSLANAVKIQIKGKDNDGRWKNTWRIKTGWFVKNVLELRMLFTQSAAEAAASRSQSSNAPVSASASTKAFVAKAHARLETDGSWTNNANRLPTDGIRKWYGQSENGTGWPLPECHGLITGWQ